MVKKLYLVLVVFFLTISSANAQMILTEEDVGLNPRTESEPTMTVMVQVQNSNLDQFTLQPVPLGEGLWLLMALGGVYGLRNLKKTRKKT